MPLDQDEPRQCTSSMGIPGEGGGGRLLPYMGFVGMCLCEGYGFPS